MPALLALAGFAKSAFSGIVQWLSRRSLAEIICITLSLALILDHIWGNHWKNVATQRQAQLVQMKHAQAEAIAAEQKANRQLEQISSDLRKATDETQAANAATAHALRMSGPGKARCPSVPRSAGNGAPVAKPDAAGPPVPPADLAAVPWNWLTDRAEEHDQLLAETIAWREWYVKVMAAWPKSQPVSVENKP
jgi:hypothetical protein